MELGVVFPQTEIGSDPVAIRDYVQAAEALGYHHILVFDHVLGAHPDRFEGIRRPPYTHETPFHEPLVLFGYLAAVTTRIELTVGVLVLPQRQTALVAKQAAEVDLLSQGRLRLGVGIGWNFVEYEALGQSFTTRAARSEEQIGLLRRLWSEELVEYQGRFDSVRQAAIAPRPARRIPIWIGGTAEPVLRRIARLGDGWFPQFPPDDEARATLERLRGYVREAGRREADVGIEGRITLAQTPEDDWGTVVERWRALAPNYVGVNTMNLGLATPQAHIETLRRFKETTGA